MRLCAGCAHHDRQGNWLVVTGLFWRIFNGQNIGSRTGFGNGLKAAENTYYIVLVMGSVDKSPSTCIAANRWGNLRKQQAALSLFLLVTERRCEWQNSPKNLKTAIT